MEVAIGASEIGDHRFAQGRRNIEEFIARGTPSCQQAPHNDSAIEKIRQSVRRFTDNFRSALEL
jgi:hypothetical protein